MAIPPDGKPANPVVLDKDGNEVVRTDSQGRPLTTAAQFALNEKSNRYQAPLYDPQADPRTAAFLAPYLMYNPGRIRGQDYSTAGTPQVGTYDPLGQGYYISELEHRVEEAERKRKKKAKFGNIGAITGAVVGGVAGFFVGGPMGAVAGASYGASIGESGGNAVYGLEEDEPIGQDVQNGLATAQRGYADYNSGGLDGATTSGAGSANSGITTGSGASIGAKSTKPLPSGLAMDNYGNNSNTLPSATSAASPVAKQTAPVVVDPSKPTPSTPATMARVKLAPRDLDAEAKKTDKITEQGRVMINEFARRDGHSSAILTSIAIQESNLNANAHLRDDTGQAVGLMQLRAPAYSDVMGLGRNYKFTDADVKVLKNAKDNVSIGSKYLSSQFTRYGAQSTQEALAGYYGGPSMIEKYRKGESPGDVNQYVKDVYRRAEIIDERQRRKAISNQVASQIAASAGYDPRAGSYGDWGGS